MKKYTRWIAQLDYSPLHLVWERSPIVYANVGDDARPKGTRIYVYFSGGENEVTNGHPLEESEAFRLYNVAVFVWMAEHE